MAQWMREINIAEEFKTEDVGLLSRTIVQQLKDMKPFNVNPTFNESIKREIETLISTFSMLVDGSELGEDEEELRDEFDSAMSDLYDFGDTTVPSDKGNKKVCWINT